MTINESGPNALVFLHAKDYYEATHSMAKIHIYPFLTNLAFSIELLFKSMLVDSRIPLSKIEEEEYLCESRIRDHRHDLIELFRQIPAKHQVRIVQEYMDLSGKDFLRDLEEYRTIFMDGRYIYERTRTGIKTGNLENIGKVVFKVSREIIGQRLIDCPVTDSERP